MLVAAGISAPHSTPYLMDCARPYGRTQLVTFLDHLNGLCEKIQFTMEIEEENHLPFLAVSVKKNENNLTTSVFHKKTHTNRYLQFRSHHHSQIKTSVVSCLNSRAERVCAVPQPIGLTSRQPPTVDMSKKSAVPMNSMSEKSKGPLSLHCYLQQVVESAAAVFCRSDTSLTTQQWGGFTQIEFRLAEISSPVSQVT